MATHTDRGPFGEGHLDLPSSGRPIFVLGCPRSGTTLLRVILNAHPNIAIPPENRWVMPLYFRRDELGKRGSKSAAKNMARKITKPGRGFGRMGISADDVRNELLERRPRDVGQAMDIVFTMFAERQGKSRWGDKRPRYYAFADELSRMHPHGQFVHLVRDGRACAASLKRPPFDHHSSKAISTWLNAMWALGRSGKRLGPERYMEVRYEDLVTDTEKTVRQLCDFLGEEFDPAMLRPEEVVALHVPKDFQQHGQIARGINTGSVEAWKRELSRSELGVFDTLGAKALRRRGYELANSRPGPLLLARVAARHALFRIVMRFTRVLDRQRVRRTIRGRLSAIAWRILQPRRWLIYGRRDVEAR